MNQLLAIAFGGACGAVLRFLLSSGVYQWLGRGFPYGTLAVNIIGSFLLGMLTEALILQRLAIAYEKTNRIEDAKKAYMRIRDEFPRSFQGRDVEKSLATLGVLD